VGWSDIPDCYRSTAGSISPIGPFGDRAGQDIQPILPLGDGPVHRQAGCSCRPLATGKGQYCDPIPPLGDGADCRLRRLQTAEFSSYLGCPSRHHQWLAMACSAAGTQVARTLIGWRQRSLHLLYRRTLSR